MTNHPPLGSEKPIFGHPDKDFDGKLILAVHGMGDQFRNDFIQGVAHLFAHNLAVEGNLQDQTTTLPLGAWDAGRETHVDDEAVFYRKCHESCSTPLGNYAFAEVYWADVARTLEKEDYRIEEVRHWARTVVERIGQRYGGGHGLAPKSMHLAAFVVEEIAEMLTALGAIVSLTKPFGFSRRSFDQSIIAYLGDVQQAGDYVRQREKFRLRFLNRLSWLSARYPKAEIHIIAHSEGSAVSLYSLLTVLDQNFTGCVTRFQDAWKLETQPVRNTRKWFDEFWEKERSNEGARKEWVHSRWLNLREKDDDSYLLDFGWVKRLRSFTTLGSPIDKHLILWPEMWTDFAAGARWFRPEEKIRWRNYYDYADPVGYELDTARKKLVGEPAKDGKPAEPAEWGCEAFQFAPEDDHGFRRYLISGKAHTDYFSDYDLFSYLMKDSVEASPQPGRKPASNFKGRLGRVLPFVLVLLLMTLAVLCLHRGVLGDTSSREWEKVYRHATGILGMSPEMVRTGGVGTKGIVGCTMLLLGTTVFARIFRLSTNFWMRALGVVAWGSGIVAFWCLPGYFALESAYLAGGRLLDGVLPMKDVCRILFIAGTLLAVMLGWAADAWAIHKRKRPIMGLRIFIGGVSAVLFLTLVIPRLGDNSNASAMGLAAAWVGFTLCWWIATMAFDLAFCWQRYINVERSWLSVVREARQDKMGE